MTVEGGAARPLSAGLRDRVLAASREVRDPGVALPHVPEISPVEAFARAADALGGLLAGLAPEAWTHRTIRDLDVQGLVGHLLGVEEDMHRVLDGEPAGVETADHVAVTQSAVERQAGRDPALTHAEWRRAVDDTLARLRPPTADLLDREVGLHGLRLPLGKLLVVRAFELWVHENDIRRGVGMPLSAPDGSTLHLMTHLAGALLPHSVQRVTAGLDGHDVRVVLTGVGGGVWDLPGRAERSAAGTTRIVTDAVSFCRLVANRVRPDDIDIHVAGDATVAGRVLAAAAALALD